MSWKARPQLWLLLRSNLVRSKCSSKDCSSASRSSNVFAESANLGKSQSRSGSTTSATSIISVPDLESCTLASSRSPTTGKSTEWQLVALSTPLLLVVAEVLLVLTSVPFDRTSATPPLRRSSGKPRWWLPLWCDATDSGWISSMCGSKRVGGKKKLLNTSSCKSKSSCLCRLELSPSFLESSANLRFCYNVKS